jgi:hypothetical protein
MFWMTVGHARRQTAREIGPSTIERSNAARGAALAGGELAGISAAAVAAAVAVAVDAGADSMSDLTTVQR